MRRIDRNDYHVLRSARGLKASARQNGLDFSGPLTVYGVAGVVSAPLLAWAPYEIYELWWLVAPTVLYVYYRYRSRLAGIITPARAVSHRWVLPLS